MAYFLIYFLERKNFINTVKLFGILFEIVVRGKSVFIEPKYKYNYYLTEFQQNKLLEIQNKLFNKFSNNVINKITLLKK